MNDKLEIYKEKIFDEIKRIDENGREFWYARELQLVLDYKEWRKFSGVIENAKEACALSGNIVTDHFVDSDKIVKAGATTKKIKDYILSRYACYLIVQNADSRKSTIALGQTYFAIQTRRQELLDEEIALMSENQKRLQLRSQVKDGNKILSETVYDLGARTNKEFADFHNEGYTGLYGGETVKMIKKRKNIEDKEDILDYMGSTELAANWFRITQTDEAIKQNNVDNLDEASKTHNKVGKEIRKTMKKLSGIYPEELPTPEKSIKQIEKEELKQLEKQKT